MNECNKSNREQHSMLLMCVGLLSGSEQLAWWKTRDRVYPHTVEDCALRWYFDDKAAGTDVKRLGHESLHTD
jgi:hypothetical protein